jgi:RNA-directed DNA polymerase
MDWSIHTLHKSAIKEHSEEIALGIKDYALNLISQNLPVIFSLTHLAHITGVDSSILEQSIARTRERADYNIFAIRKRSGGKRYIHASRSELFSVQKFLNQELLQKLSCHSSAYAFSKGSSIYKCAAQHCDARWLLQFDLKDFFYSINEHQVFDLFLSLGYKKLLAFEMARICTTTRLPLEKRKYLIEIEKWRRISENLPYEPLSTIGVLPQGAPTSPMLSNMIAKDLDVDISKYATSNNLIYTRYADDITLSAYSLDKKRIGKILNSVHHLIIEHGFHENLKKRRVSGPGSRKVVLGLLIDNEKPRLQKHTKKRINGILYAINKFGLKATADHIGFQSTLGLYHHIGGLISSIKNIDIGYFFKQIAETEVCG